MRVTPEKGEQDGGSEELSTACDTRLNFLQKLIVILPFVLYFLIATYKLAEPSLWVDETIEYITSSKTFDVLHEMIQNASLQPPLYNLLLFFWLKINQSVFWYRFLSVIFGFIGAIGFYKSVKEISGKNLALLAVVVYSCVFRLVYHFQEAAEYALMIGNICWAAYYFIKSIKKPSIKSLVLFNIFCILSFLSQYGATIVVVAFALLLLYRAIIGKDKTTIKNLILLYLADIVLVFIPIYLIYIRYQTQMVCYVADLFNMQVDKNIFFDFTNAFIRTVKYNFFPNLTYETKEIYMNFYIPNIFINILMFFFLAMFAVAVVKFLYSKQKNNTITYLLWSSLIAWISFYIFTKMGLYSYGDFGYRWGLFITPLWLLTVIVTINEFLIVLKFSHKKLTNKILNIVCKITILMTIIYCLTGTYCIYKHWEKENIKGMVQKWYEMDGFKEETIVYYGSAYGFEYYLQQDSRHKDSYCENIVYMPWSDNKTYDEYNILFSDLLKNKFDYRVINFCCSHTTEDVMTVLKLFKDKGYRVQVVYNSYDATIYKLTKIK